MWPYQAVFQKSNLLQANIYLFKVKNRNNTKRCKVVTS